MRIFQRTLLLTLQVFLSQAINLIPAIAAGNPGNHNDLLIIIHDMCNANKKALPALNYSKKIIPHKIFFEILNAKSG